MGRQAGAVNLDAIAYDAGNDAKARRYAGCSWADGGCERRVEHVRIDFARTTIDVDKGAWEARRDQRRAKFGHGRKQLLHKGVFGFAQRHRIEPALTGK